MKQDKRPKQAVPRMILTFPERSPYPSFASVPERGKRRESPATTRKAIPMPHLSIKTAIGRRLAAAGLAFAVAAGLVSALWLTSSTDPAEARVTQTASSLDSALATDGDRTELRQDLKAARELEGQARKDAIKQIRADAKAGKYGDKIEKRFDRRADRRAAVFALLPDELQADLKKLRAMEPGEERKAYRDEIRQKALDGGYGNKVKEAAEKLKGHWND